MFLIVQGKSSFILWSTLINIILQTSEISVSYKMKQVKQDAWTIVQKNKDGSKTRVKSYLFCGVFVLMVIIGLISISAVTSMSTKCDYKSDHKDYRNFLEPTLLEILMNIFFFLQLLVNLEYA